MKFVDDDDDDDDDDDHCMETQQSVYHQFSIV